MKRLSFSNWYNYLMVRMRTNQEWLAELSSSGKAQIEAITELRDHLLRASLFTFNRNLNSRDRISQDQIEQMAEDCTQEALMAVMQHLADFRGDSKFTTWVYKFAVNASLMALRREKWKTISLDDLKDSNIVDQRKPFDPDLLSMRSELVAAIRTAIQNELSDRQQQVLKLIVFDEVPMDVVVERLGTNRNAIYKLLHDARRKLKMSLQKNGFGLEEALELFSSKK